MLDTNIFAKMEQYLQKKSMVEKYILNLMIINEDKTNDCYLYFEII